MFRSELTVPVLLIVSGLIYCGLAWLFNKGGVR